MHKKRLLQAIYSWLLECFGPQHWWPAVHISPPKSTTSRGQPFEIAVGAILTQNTSWKNVEKAIANLKAAKVLSPRKLHSLAERKLAALIRPSGYYNIKAKRLRAFLALLCEKYGGSLKRMFRLSLEKMREELLSVKGIGEETADSIILYAAEKPTFVVDAYTRRILSRHGLCRPTASYSRLKEIFECNLAPDTGLYNEYHALLVRLGNTYCRARAPQCDKCPLNRLPKIELPTRA